MRREKVSMLFVCVSVLFSVSRFVYADTVTLPGGTYGGVLDYSGRDVVISEIISVQMWDGTADSGRLEIRANNITVTSTGLIDGSGRGFGGGGGGAGAHGYSLAGNGGNSGTPLISLRDGQPGGNAIEQPQRGGDGGQGAGYGGGGGGGGGAWVNSGGIPGSGSAGGGNGANGSNGDTTYTGWLFTGGGGGGGTGDGTLAGSGAIPSGGAGAAGGGYGGAGGLNGDLHRDGGGGGGGGAGSFGGSGGAGGDAAHLDGWPGQ